jgi:hypothetical protein
MMHPPRSAGPISGALAASRAGLVLGQRPGAEGGWRRSCVAGRAWHGTLSSAGLGIGIGERGGIDRRGGRRAEAREPILQRLQHRSAIYGSNSRSRVNRLLGKPRVKVRCRDRSSLYSQRQRHLRIERSLDEHFKRVSAFLQELNKPLARDAAHCQHRGAGHPRFSSSTKSRTAPHLKNPLPPSASIEFC